MPYLSYNSSFLMSVKFEDIAIVPVASTYTEQVLATSVELQSPSAMNKNYLVCILSLFTLHAAGAPLFHPRAFRCGNSTLLPEGSDCQARFREVLQCVSVPAGVFGFYAWFCLLLLPIGNIIVMMANDVEPWDMALKIAATVLTTLLATISMYQNITSLTRCEHVQEFSLVRPLVLTLLASDICALAAGVTVAFWKVDGIFIRVTGTLYAAASGIAGVGGWVSLLPPIVNGRAFLSLIPRPLTTLCSLGFLVATPSILAWFLLTTKSGRLPEWVRFLIVYPVISGVFGAFGFLFLGKWAGDVWGTYWAKEPVGTLLAVVVPIVLLGNAGLVLYVVLDKRKL